MSPSIESARSLIQREHTRAGRRWRQTQEQQAQLESLEQLMDEIETANLGSEGRVAPEVWRRIDELCQWIPVPPPRDLWRAQQAPRLHDALLRWQDSLLDRVAPQRLQFSDRHD